MIEQCRYVPTLEEVRNAIILIVFVMALSAMAVTILATILRDVFDG